MTRVRAARREELPALAHVLGAAFTETATFRALVADDGARARLLPAYFAGTLQFLLGRPGTVLVAEGSSGAAVGVAGWAPPGRWKAPWWHAVRTVPALVRSADGATLRAFGRTGPAIDRALQEAHPSHPHWYLCVLATAPAAQGTGAGSALVTAGLERARVANMPAYLECEERLVPYYAQFGFSVAHEIALPDGLPAQVGMEAR